MLANQALDILMPTLPRRLPLAGDSRMPIWIRCTKKILLEEGHSIPNLIHIFQLIVRHSDLFYSCRAQFVPQIVNSLIRLGFRYSRTAESTLLSLELAGLVVGWERRRQNEMKVVADSDIRNENTEGFDPGPLSADPKRSVDGMTFPEDTTKSAEVEPGVQSLCVLSPGGALSIPNIETPGPASQPDEEYKPNAATTEFIFNFLLRVRLPSTLYFSYDKQVRSFEDASFLELETLFVHIAWVYFPLSTASFKLYHDIFSITVEYLQSFIQCP